ncbi:MAG: hydrogen peroxide-inducible genes activator [Halieaceae bacterium]|nr:hydrogen peroxide-inducible genes activator [Halieaceae bacterium]
MRSPSLKQIRYILSVARAGSFRGAAEELGVSQPTLTAQVARAEKLLGSTLFERSRNGALLTPAGRLFEPQARRVLEAAEELGRCVDGSSVDDRATYRLGVKSTLGPYLLPPILPSLRKAHGDLRLFVREDHPRYLETGLATGEYDLILSSLPINNPEFVQAPLLRERILLAVPGDHPLAQRRTWKAEDLRGAKVLTTQPGHLFTQRVEEICHRLGAEIQRDYEGSSLDALRLMVVMGMGVAFLPALYVESEIRADSGIVVGSLEDEVVERRHVLAWRPASPARHFYRRLAGELRRLIDERLGHTVEVTEHF